MAKPDIRKPPVPSPKAGSETGAGETTDTPPSAGTRAEGAGVAAGPAGDSHVPPLTGFGHTGVPAGTLRAALPPAVAGAALVAASVFWSVPAGFTAAALALTGAAWFVTAARRPSAGLHAAPPERVPPPSEPPMPAVLDALARPAFLLDRNGAIRFINRSARTQFPGARIGTALTMTFRAPLLREALAQAASGEGARLEYLERGETDRLYTMVIEPVGTDAGLLVVLEDATERMAVARMRADFVSNASHELRTPLASLTGFIETLQGPARGDAEASRRFLAIMLEQAERMRRLIDDLLSLSRVEMRAHLQPAETVDLVDVVIHVADAMSPLAGDLGVEMVLDLPDDPVPVRGDRDELIQVFENLIENGLKYGESGKRLDISLTAGAPAGSTSDRVRVRIRDHGPGIAPQDLPRLTERFYRVDIETSRRKQGTGLGLAIVKHILARHRAEMTIESTMGEGACFCISMDCAGNLQAAEENV